MTETNHCHLFTVVEMNMKIQLLTLAVFAFGCLESSYGNSNDKAALTGFKALVEALTGRSAVDFNGYGNWCGIGGEGDTIDDVDACCKTHDFCYEDAGKKECKDEAKAYIYVAPYSYDTVKGKSVTCTEGKGFFSGAVKLLSKSKYNCGRAICFCDADAARCFAKAPYNKANKKHIFTSG